MSEPWKCLVCGAITAHKHAGLSHCVDHLMAERDAYRKLLKQSWASLCEIGDQFAARKASAGNREIGVAMKRIREALEK